MIKIEISIVNKKKETIILFSFIMFYSNDDITIDWSQLANLKLQSNVSPSARDSFWIVFFNTNEMQTDNPSMGHTIR